MHTPETLGVAVIGAGPGGTAAALEAARHGARVTLIEREHPGGTCLNWGCIPTKTLLATAEILHRASLGAEMGLGETPPTLDWAALRARSARVVDRLRQAHHQEYRRAGIAYLAGSAKFIAAHRLSVEAPGGERSVIEADRVIIAAGSRPGGLPGLEPDGERILNSSHALTLVTLPRSLLIVGGGVIGCEFANLFSDLGVEVTLVEALPGLLALTDIDAEVIRELARCFKKRGIATHFDRRVDSLLPHGEGLLARLSDGRMIETEKALICIGRRLNTEDLGLEEIGVPVGPSAEIHVDQHLMTAVEGVYAIGDITGQAQLAHVATHHGLIAARHALGDSGARFDSSAVPGVVFTRPCVASVGLSEQEAERRGIAVVCPKIGARMLGKAHAVGELDGVFKLVAERGSGRLLGAHLMGAGAEDLIAEATLAVRHGLTLSQIADTIHAHPTMSEGLWEAARSGLH